MALILNDQLPVAKVGGRWLSRRTLMDEWIDGRLVTQAGLKPLTGMTAIVALMKSLGFDSQAAAKALKVIRRKHNSRTKYISPVKRKRAKRDK